MSAKKKQPVAATATPAVDPTKITIDRITMIHGNLDTTEEYLNKPIKPHQVKVDFGHRSGIAWKAGKTYNRLFVELEALNDKGEALGLRASYAFEFRFTIQDFESFKVKKENGDIRLLPVLASALMGIIFSTARGMVLERTKGTYLGGVILPVIAPKDLLKSWREG